MLPFQTPPPDYEEDATTWIALSDLMTGLMAIFLALSIAILVQNREDQIVISKSVVDALQKKHIDVQADAKTGDVILTERVSFALGQDTLTAEGRATLNAFIPVYAEAIFGELTPTQLERISRLVVEGHTDRTGDYLYNMNLSSRRAYAILAHIHGMPEFPHKQALLARMTAVGRGPNDASGHHDADRKVLFRFDFKNSFEHSSDREAVLAVPEQIDAPLPASQ